MSRRGYDVKLAGLLAVGVLGLTAAALLGWVTARDVGAEQQPHATRTPGVDSGARRVASPAGDFSLRVPRDMRVRRVDGSLRITAPDGTLVMTAARFRGGSLREATLQLLDTVREEYARVRVLGHTRSRVHGRDALLTHGRATNAEGVRLTFAVVMVRARPEHFAITTFAAAGADPATVVPRAETIARSFRVSR